MDGGVWMEGKVEVVGWVMVGVARAVFKKIVPIVGLGAMVAIDLNIFGSVGDVRRGKVVWRK